MFIKGMTAQTSIFARFDVIKKPLIKVALHLKWCASHREAFQAMTNTNSFLTMFQSTLIVIKCVPVILQCKLFAPRHEVIAVYAHRRTGFAHCHLLAFVDNHNRPSSLRQKSIAACLLIFLRYAHDSTRL